MSSHKYAIGIDFGTESARTSLVDLQDGQEMATAVYAYADGVIDERLPGSKIRLEPDWALQNPQDYVAAIAATVPKVLAESKVAAEDVIGLGIDFTACTMLPTKADGTPLCALAQYRDNPACLGQAVEAPRGPTGGGPGEPDGARAWRELALSLWGQDLVRVVLPQGAADPQRGARDL